LRGASKGNLGNPGRAGIGGILCNFLGNLIGLYKHNGEEVTNSIVYILGSKKGMVMAKDLG
jgi:hypothetical protein